ncbi:NAD-dependent epimerase/dehydratase family protein [Lachnospiraceae bacterium WCA-9-b2]|jgi:nucleoside-diphosphate-sugar epimerase|uniref:NAD-dependent epimerase/dehydratase family protein n=1 Tax=Sporofaciens musculi TaxID=2681861 RepID=A0A7X3MKL5_9FIRM|nr:GDP-mannose 4,6-dehydratase [Sporofaciens musculi]MCI9421471.1 NAD-dependent epimerase/dehydratase family protein [Dorea sp.]MXP78105.1 NAD-dependent epimerase/dehydratase family protein [Sporofaciens musculi]
MKKILITGGKGFIGSHITRYLKECGYDVIAPSSGELNVTKQDNWGKWKGKNVCHVLHLAGKTFIPDSWENPEQFFETNGIGTLNAVSFCKNQKIGMTYISAYIYGQPTYNPVPETAAVHPNNPYAKSKYMAEEICEFFGKYFGMDITVLRLFNVYGARQSERFLIPLIVSQALGERDRITVQDLEPKRDYVYIDDVCRAIELSVQKTKGYHLFNIGSGGSYSVREIIEKVQKAAGTKKSVSSVNKVRRNELNDVIADISSIQETWGWEPQITIEAGLLRCVEDAR